MALDKPIRVSITVTSGDVETVTRASEAFSRAANGLALEGVPAFMMWIEAEDGEFPASEGEL